MNGPRDTGETTPTSGELLVRHGVDHGRTASAAIVDAVAAATGDEPTALPPLGYAVDTDALDALLSDDKPVDLSFAYAGVDVRVERSETILVLRQSMEG